MCDFQLLLLLLVIATFIEISAYTVFLALFSAKSVSTPAVAAAIRETVRAHLCGWFRETEPRTRTFLLVGLEKENLLRSRASEKSSQLSSSRKKVGKFLGVAKLLVRVCSRF